VSSRSVQFTDDLLEVVEGHDVAGAPKVSGTSITYGISSTGPATRFKSVPEAHLLAIGPGLPDGLAGHAGGLSCALER